MDPVGILAGQINPYSYCGNNSLSFVDPLGLVQFPYEPANPVRWSNPRNWANYSRELRRRGQVPYFVAAFEHNQITSRGNGYTYGFAPNGFDVEWRNHLSVWTAFAGPSLFPHEVNVYLFSRLIEPPVRKFLLGDKNLDMLQAYLNTLDAENWKAVFEAYRDRTGFWWSWAVPIWRAFDPNELAGPAGYGAAQFVRADGRLPYTIHFENEASATAPAQRVMLSNQLTNRLDWTTFELTEIAFGDQFIAVPPKAQHFEHTATLSQDGYQFDVRIEAGIRPDTGEVYALFQSLDPATGLPPPVELGLLPPEDGTGRGQGHLSYVVRPEASLPTGTEIRNVALIKFDTEPLIATNQRDPHDPSQGTDPAKEALATLDAGTPASQVQALPPLSTAASFTVEWSGQDDVGGSGVSSFDIYVQDDGGPWTVWLSGTASTSAGFVGHTGHTYGFYSVVRDHVGNQESSAPAAEAWTQVTGPPTAAELASFQCVRTGPSRVALRWRTLTEVRTLGFHVDRALAGGPWQRITSGLVPARGGSHGSPDYQIEDYGAAEVAGVAYRLVAMDLNGLPRVLAVASLNQGTEVTLARTGEGFRLRLEGPAQASLVVETATDLRGPWTRVDGVALDDEGAAVLTLGPAESERVRFFRTTQP